MIVLFHTAVIVNYILFLMHGISITEALNNFTPQCEQFGGPLKYLTNWNVLLQSIYFAIALFNVIFGSDSKTAEMSSKVQKLRDFIFGSLALPIGGFVTISFWFIYLVNRNLIFPKELEQFFPPIVNHLMHTTPLLSQIFELLFIFHIQPKRLHGLRYHAKMIKPNADSL